MKKWLIFALVLLLISGCGAAENTVPPLTEFAGLTGTEAGEMLSGLNRDELIAAWGEADGHCSGLFCDFYDIDGDRYLGIYYDGSACVESVRIFEKEEPDAVFMLNFYRYGLGLCGTGAGDTFHSSTGQGIFDGN